MHFPPIFLTLIFYCSAPAYSAEICASEHSRATGRELQALRLCNLQLSKDRLDTYSSASTGALVVYSMGMAYLKILDSDSSVANYWDWSVIYAALFTSFATTMLSMHKLYSINNIMDRFDLPWPPLEPTSIAKDMLYGAGAGAALVMARHCVD